MKFVASINTVIYGIPYAQGAEINLTGWTRKQMLQFLGLGLITSSLGGDELVSVLSFVGEGVSTETDTYGNITVYITQTLDFLADVDVSTTPPTDGQVLRFNAASGKWIPG